MEPALKQRLLGAVVLIALAIIFVPMLFSGSGPKQDSSTVNLELPPPPSREFETRVLPVDAGNRDASPMPSREAMPAARYVTMKDCGHFAYLECPAAVRQEIDAFFHSARAPVRPK